MSKIATILSLLLYLLLAKPGVAVEAAPPVCAHVYYIACMFSDVKDKDIMEEDLRKMNLYLPYYVGAVCLNEQNQASIYPSTDKLFMYPQLKSAMNKINTADSLSLTYYPKKNKWFEEIADWTSPSTYRGHKVANVYRNNPYFYVFVESTLTEYGFTTFRYETDAEPDLDWHPEFKQTLPFPDYTYEQGLEFGKYYLENTAILSIPKEYIDH